MPFSYLITAIAQYIIAWATVTKTALCCTLDHSRPIVTLAIFPTLLLANAITESALLRIVNYSRAHHYTCALSSLLLAIGQAGSNIRNYVLNSRLMSSELNARSEM